MPRYYFDVRDKTGDLHDEVGEDLVDERAAADEAVKVATSIAREGVGFDGSIAVIVRQDQSPVFTLKLTINIDRVTG